MSTHASRANPWRNASPLGMIFSAVLVIFYTVIFLIPFGIAIWLSFQNWDFIVDPKFIGIRNYVRAFSDGYFWQALRVTVIFSFAEIGIAVAIALTIAFLLSRLPSRSQRFYLALCYLPVVTPTLVSILLWRWLYLPSDGVFNSILRSIGLPAQPFLDSNSQALWCIIAMVIWAHLGSGIVLYLAGINDVPEQLLEAATLDGAGALTQFRYIILPLLGPVIFFNVVVSVISTVQMFEQFYIMSGPGFSTRTLALYTYQLGFQSVNLGYGAALSMLIFVLLLAATVVQFRAYNVRWEY